MITKDKIWINYEDTVFEDFIPIERDMWVIFANNDGSYIWATKCVGYFKVIQNPYTRVNDQDYYKRTEREIVYEYAVISPMEGSEPLPARYVGGKIVGVCFRKPSVGDVKIEDEIDLTSDHKLMEELVKRGDVLKNKKMEVKEDVTTTEPKNIFSY